MIPSVPPPDDVDDLISTVAEDTHPDLEAARTALVAVIPDGALAIRISDHFGAHMAAYGDAGYYVGLAMRLELAVLIHGAVTAEPAGSR